MSSDTSLVNRLLGSTPVPQRVDIGHDALPPRLRTQATLGVLDVTEWFGDTSGGIRTYLLQKAQYNVKVAALYEKNGQGPMALNHYREALKSDPANVLATEAVKRLGGEAK